MHGHFRPGTFLPTHLAFLDVEDVWSLVEGTSWVATIVFGVLTVYLTFRGRADESASPWPFLAGSLFVVFLIVALLVTFFGLPGNPSEGNSPSAPSSTGEEDGGSTGEASLPPLESTAGETGTLSYGAPEVFPWRLQYLGDECGSSTATYTDSINWDDVVGDPDPGEPDVAYRVRDYCSEDTTVYSPEDARGGLVEPGEATEAIACRSAAVAGALPSYLSPSTRERLGVVEGAAFCIVTDRGRVVRAQIDTITEGEDGPREVILTLEGEATVWSPQ